jgi:hypothetical protein
MKSILFIGGLCIAASASAQPIHGQPQNKAFYASSAEWPFLSEQCHWMPANPSTATDDGVASPDFFPEARDPQNGHTHLEVSAPYAGEISGPMVVPFTLRLFHTAGEIQFLYGNLVRDIVWDATGSGTPPRMNGDPAGLVTWTGHFTIDPALAASDHGDGAQPVPPRGWFEVRLVTRTQYQNGDRLDNNFYFPMYAVLDPQAPETAPIGAVGLLARCLPSSSRDAVSSALGVSAIDVLGTTLPILAPIQSPQTIDSHTYGYGTDPSLPDGISELRLDPDLHHGAVGTPLRINTGPVAVGTADRDVIDPKVLGSGAHKLAFVWMQPTNTGSALVTADEQVSTLMVVTVTVGDGVESAPPPIIVPPPPPPVVTWQTITALLQRFGSEDRYRLCATPDHCVELVVK